jgi:hypothetical protein
MGWRYEVIVLGCMTLFVFFLRFVVFTFHESPKFLLSRGREADAIEVLHKIAKFNRAPPPELTMEMFRAIDEAEVLAEGDVVPVSTADASKHAVKNFFANFKHLKDVFGNKLRAFTFVLLAIAYMVGFSPNGPSSFYSNSPTNFSLRVTTGPSTWPENIFPSSSSATTSTAAGAPCQTRTDNTSTSTSRVSSALS